MNTINYIKFFDECLNHNMIVKELIPVQEHIFKIVEFANKSNGYPMSYTSKINLCGHILDIFTKIIDNKKFDNLDEIVDFVLFLKPSNEAITNFIETIIFRYPFEETTRFDYCYNFACICVDGRDMIDEVINYNSKLRIVELVKKYLYYTKLYVAKGNINMKSSYISLDPIAHQFHNIAIGVMADIYASDLDINILDKFLDSLFYDQDNTMEYLGLNGLLRDHIYDYGIKNAIEIIKLYNEKKDNNLLIK